MKMTLPTELPDFKDMANQTGKCPGYRVRVWHDGETIGLALMAVDSEDPLDEYGIALNRDQAVSLRDALQEAIASCGGQ